MRSTAWTGFLSLSTVLTALIGAAMPERGLAQQPTSGAAGSNHAALLKAYAEGDMSGLYESAREQTRADASDFAAWTWRGIGAEAGGLQDEAADAFKSALEHNPTYLPAIVDLGNLQARRQQWSAAYAQYQRALTLSPDSLEARVGLAEIYRLNGSWQEAAGLYQQAGARLTADASRIAALCAQAAREAADAGSPSAATLLALSSSGYQPAPALPDAARGIDPAIFEHPPEPESIPLHISFLRGKYDVADLAPGALVQLEALAAVLKTPGWENRRLIIEGHACACGPAAANVALGMRRAEAVRQYLIRKHGWRPDRLVATSAGSANPITPESAHSLSPAECARDAGHASNRRVIVRERRLAADEPIARITFLYRPHGEQDFRVLPPNATLYSGDEFQLSIRAFRTTYAYALHHSSGGNEWYGLFPNPAIERSSRASNPLSAYRDYLIPASQTGMRLDDNPGAEETTVCVAGRPLADLEARVRAQEAHTRESGSEAVETSAFRGMRQVSPEESGRSILPSESCVRVRFDHQTPERH